MWPFTKINKCRNKRKSLLGFKYNGSCVADATYIRRAMIPRGKYLLITTCTRCRRELPDRVVSRPYLVTLGYSRKKLFDMPYLGKAVSVELLRT